MAIAIKLMYENEQENCVVVVRSGGMQTNCNRNGVVHYFVDTDICPKTLERERDSLSGRGFRWPGGKPSLDFRAHNPSNKAHANKADELNNFSNIDLFILRLSFNKLFDDHF